MEEDRTYDPHKHVKTALSMFMTQLHKDVKDYIQSEEFMVNIEIKIAGAQRYENKLIEYSKILGEIMQNLPNAVRPTKQ